MNQFKNLEMWKRAVDFATAIYEVTSTFPNEEKYGLTSQLRRCAVSIGSNIAYGSSYELETQLIIATNLELIDVSLSEELYNEIDELQKMIYTFAKGLGKNS